MAYLDYNPSPFDKADARRQNYKSYLDRLGFDHWDIEIALEARLQFIGDLRAHLCVPETVHLRKSDNPAAFHALINGFLLEHGTKYFGETERDHLAEKDPQKGFLYPRDAQRENSRLFARLEDIFNYKASCSQHNDRNRPVERQVVPHIDFASLQPSEINSMGKNKINVSIDGSFRELSRAHQGEVEDLLNNSDDDSRSERRYHEEEEEEILIDSDDDWDSDRWSELEDPVQEADRGFNKLIGKREIRKSGRISRMPRRSTDEHLYNELAVDAMDQSFKQFGTNAIRRNFSGTQLAGSNSMREAHPSAVARKSAPSMKTAEHQKFTSPGIPAASKTIPTALNTLRPESATASHKRRAAKKIATVRKRSKVNQTFPSPAKSQSTPIACEANKGTESVKQFTNAPASPILGNHKRSTPSHAATPIADEVVDLDRVIVPGRTSLDAEASLFESNGPGVPTPAAQRKIAELNIETKQLPSLIEENIVLKVTASSQLEMAPVTVKLVSYKASENFFDFLAAECELEGLAKSVTAISATYTWNYRKHRFRKNRLDVDWIAFCDQLKDAFRKYPDLYTRGGCEIEMLLHVVK
ncbi:hypothetical protein MMC13_007743 [Lambiella insularis]|nr:hypothetical protein [Lambiella insularis]